MRTYYHFTLSLFSMAALLAAATGCSSDDASAGPATPGQGGDFAGGTGGASGTSGTSSSDSGTTIQQEASTGGSDTPESVCRDAVLAQCQRRADCGTSSGLQCFGYANLCPDYYFSPGSNRTVEGVRACVSAIQRLSCSDLAVDALPDCLIGGTKTMGMACAFGSQCASTYCVGGSQSCAKCSDIAKVGESCGGGATECATGSFCNRSTMKCESMASIVHGTEGAACNENASPVLDCDGDLLCMGTGNTPSTCVQRVSENSACTGLGGVPCVLGSVCVRDPATNGGVCRSIASCGATPCDASSYCNYSMTPPACVSRATEGKTCSITYDTGIVPCITGTTCTPIGGGAGRGVCLKPGNALAVTCSDTTTCPYPLQCQNGKCAGLDPATCN